MKQNQKWVSALKSLIFASPSKLSFHHPTSPTTDCEAGWGLSVPAHFLNQAFYIRDYFCQLKSFMVFNIVKAHYSNGTYEMHEHIIKEFGKRMITYHKYKENSVWLYLHQENAFRVINAVAIALIVVWKTIDRSWYRRMKSCKSTLQSVDAQTGLYLETGPETITRYRIKFTSIKQLAYTTVFSLYFRKFILLQVDTERTPTS